MERANDQAQAQETANDMVMLKRYKIINLIGVGNYARVYKASLVSQNKDLAVKAINLAKTTDNYRQKFLPRELSILRRVNHENICKVYEIIQVSDRIYIVMQFCSRGTIADLLQKSGGPFNEPLVRYLFGPTVNAVAYLHSLDIAHRDIKIENILLDHNYVPKLSDFSYSCLISRRERSDSNRNGRGSSSSRSVRLNETFCGTLPYLSPEMIRHQPYDPKKTDTWSLGVCLYVLFNDRLPFPFNDIKTMVKRQLTKDYEFRSFAEASIQARELTGLLLDPDYKKRPSSLEVSRHPWFNGPRERPSASRRAKQ